MEQEQRTPETVETDGMTKDAAIVGGEQEHVSKNAIILIVLVVIVLVLVLMYVWGSRISVRDEQQVDEPTMTFEEFVTQNQAPLPEATSGANAALGGLLPSTFMEDVDALENELNAALSQ